MIRKFALALMLGASTIALPLPAMAQTSQPAPVDPVRLKLAENMAGKLIPPGTYQKLMKDMADQMANSMIEQMLGMDAAIIARSAGEDGKDVEGKSLGELASTADPHFKERMDIMMKVMFDEMGKLMSEMEPVARSALAKVYARKYSTQQLTDMSAFFATPSGTAFATDFMGTFSDKEMLEAMVGQMPKILEAMPAIMEKVEKATAHLPPAPKAAQDAAVAAGDAAIAAADDSGFPNGETGDEPWHSFENWAAADQKKVDSLEMKANGAFEASQAAQQKAIDRARERYKKEGWKPDSDMQPMAAEDIPADAVPPPAPPK